MHGYKLRFRGCLVGCQPPLNACQLPLNARQVFSNQIPRMLSFLPCRALLLIIGLPLNLVLLGLFCWYRAAGSPKRFAASFVGSGMAAVLVMTLLLLHFQRLVRGGGCTACTCAASQLAAMLPCLLQLRQPHMACGQLGVHAGTLAQPLIVHRHVASCVQEFVGFFGRSLVQGCAGKHCPKGSEPNCVVPRAIPWADLLPKGAQ